MLSVTIQAGYLFGAQPARGARTIRGGVASANHHHPAAHFRQVALARWQGARGRIGADEKIRCLINTGQVLTLQIQRRINPATHPQEERIVAFLKEVVDRLFPANVSIAHKAHTRPLQIFPDVHHQRMGQFEIRESIR